MTLATSISAFAAIGNNNSSTAAAQTPCTNDSRESQDPAGAKTVPSDKQKKEFDRVLMGIYG